MYIPEHFKETNSESISALIMNNPFGMLITAVQDGPFVSHLPFLFDRNADPKGRLLCHMARANPHWQHFTSDGECLAVFQGPHAYISPSWYASPGVPTWNYAVVHLRGSVRIIDKETEVEALLERLTHEHESPLQSPWQPTLQDERRARLLEMVVGLEIDITDIQAKFKLSQNRPQDDQLRVAEHLAQSGCQTDVALARLMQGELPC